MTNIPSIIVSEGVTPLSIYEGPYTGKPNPHAWMSTEAALIYIQNIQRALSEHDPKNAETYQKNATRYAQKVRAIRTDLEQILKPLLERLLIDGGV